MHMIHGADGPSLQYTLPDGNSLVLRRVQYGSGTANVKIERSWVEANMVRAPRAPLTLSRTEPL